MLDPYRPRREGILQAAARLEELRDERVAWVRGCLPKLVEQMRVVVAPPQLEARYRPLIDRLEGLAWRAQSTLDPALAENCQELSDDLIAADIPSYLPSQVSGTILNLRVLARTVVPTAQELALLVQEAMDLAEGRRTLPSRLGARRWRLRMARILTFLVTAAPHLLDGAALFGRRAVQMFRRRPDCPARQVGWLTGRGPGAGNSDSRIGIPLHEAELSIREVEFEGSCISKAATQGHSES